MTTLIASLIVFCPVSVARKNQQAPHTNRVAFIGANNPETGRMVRAIREADLTEFLGFFDNDPEKRGSIFCGLPVLGGFEDLSKADRTDFKLVNLITRDTHTRHTTTRDVVQMGFSLSNFIHPSIDLYGIAVGQGVYLQEGVNIQANVELGDNCCINSGSTIAHETRVGTSCFIAPGATTAGIVTLEAGSMLGVGCVVMPRLTVGRGATIGAGAVVTSDVPAMSIQAGVPARKLGVHSHGELFEPLFPSESG